MRRECGVGEMKWRVERWSLGRGRGEMRGRGEGEGLERDEGGVGGGR